MKRYFKDIKILVEQIKGTSDAIDLEGYPKKDKEYFDKNIKFCSYCNTWVSSDEISFIKYNYRRKEAEYQCRTCYYKMKEEVGR